MKYRKTKTKIENNKFCLKIKKRMICEQITGIITKSTSEFEIELFKLYRFFIKIKIKLCKWKESAENGFTLSNTNLLVKVKNTSNIGYKRKINKSGLNSL